MLREQPRIFEHGSTAVNWERREGNARWRGVPLKTLLDKRRAAGARRGHGNGMDGPVSGPRRRISVKALDYRPARDGE